MPQTDRMVTKHSLGWSTGTIYEHEDGTASFRLPGHFLDSFRVTIADVKGFSETKGGKKSMQNTLHVIGAGGEIASCDINVGVTKKIEAWFRSHPDFGQNAGAPVAPVSAVSVADELAKLASLRDNGVLTSEEFAQQKAKLLGTA